MIHIIISYLKFLIKSSNKHGVHSPFVFDLITKCFYDRTKYREYSILKYYRDSLLQNKNRIEVEDFGAGSKVFKSNLRQVSQIARTAGINRKRAALLFRIVRYFKPENILELGTSLGLATVSMATADKNVTITTLEGCRETAKIAAEQFEKFEISNVKSIHTEFDVFLNDMALHKYQLVYFDGNHNKHATLKYVELLMPTITNDTIWIFDDIHWSAEMEDAWETIKTIPAITVSIDTFQWGIVFFRKEQEKQDFVIRC